MESGLSETMDVIVTVITPDSSIAIPTEFKIAHASVTVHQFLSAPT